MSQQALAAAPDMLKALKRYEMLYAEWFALALPAAANTETFKVDFEHRRGGACGDREGYLGRRVEHRFTFLLTGDRLVS